MATKRDSALGHSTWFYTSAMHTHLIFGTSSSDSGPTSPAPASRGRVGWNPASNSGGKVEFGPGPPPSSSSSRCAPILIPESSVAE